MSIFYIITFILIIALFRESQKVELLLKGTTPETWPEQVRKLALNSNRFANLSTVLLIISLFVNTSDSPVAGYFLPIVITVCEAFAWHLEWELKELLVQPSEGSKK